MCCRWLKGSGSTNLQEEALIIHINITSQRLKHFCCDEDQNRVAALDMSDSVSALQPGLLQIHTFPLILQQQSHQEGFGPNVRSSRILLRDSQGDAQWLALWSLTAVSESEAGGVRPSTCPLRASPPGAERPWNAAITGWAKPPGVGTWWNWLKLLLFSGWKEDLNKLACQFG